MADYHFGPLFRFIEDTAIYIESGYLDLLSTATCNINTPRPAVLNYSAATTAYVNAKTTPLQGKIFLSTDETLDEFPFTGQALEDNSESKAVGCSASVKTATYTDACDTTYTVAEEDVATQGFCPLETILKKKKVMANVPSSMFSGKLRLMIQAIYGSKRTDVEVLEAAGIIVPGKLLIGGFTVSAMYQPSYGLFTSADFEYWLVELTSVVKYYPLKLSPIAQQFATILKDHPRKTEQAFAKKIEAYILATATIDEDNVITGGALEVIGGSVLYYGWHWKWDGSEADVVVHSEDNTNHRYNTTRYKLAITRVAGVFSEELTIDEEGYWWPQASGGLNIFIPEPITNRMVVVPQVIEDHTNGIPIPGQVGVIPLSPIHCFRDMGDELIIMRYSYNVSSRTDVVTVEDGATCSDEARLDRDSRTYAGLVGVNNLSVGEENYSGIISNSSNSFHQDTYPDGNFYFQEYRAAESATNYGIPLTTPMCGGVTLEEFLVGSGLYFRFGVNVFPQFHGNITIGGNTYPLRYIIALNTINRYRIQERYSTEYLLSTPVFIEIPFRDCNAVFIGKRFITQKSGHVIATETPHSFDWEGVSIWDSYFDGSNYHPIEEVVPNRPRSGNTLGFSGLTDGPTETVDLHTGDVQLYRFTDGISGDETVYTEDTPFPLSPFIDINYTIYPFVDQFDTVLEDTSGGYKFSYKATASDDAKYPGDSAVGWA